MLAKMFMFLVSLGCLHTETSFLLVPYPPDLMTLLLAVGAGITPELGTGGNTAKQSKREGGTFLTFLPVKASSDWPNTPHLALTDWLKGSALDLSAALLLFPQGKDSILPVKWGLSSGPSGYALTASTDPFISGCHVITVAESVYVRLSLSRNHTPSILKNTCK